MNTKISLGMIAALATELATTTVERHKNGYNPNINAIAFHHSGVTIPHIFDSAEQKEKFHLKTIKNR